MKEYYDLFPLKMKDLEVYYFLGINNPSGFEFHSEMWGGVRGLYDITCGMTAKQYLDTVIRQG